jgi:hypothetical protein
MAGAGARSAGDGAAARPQSTRRGWSLLRRTLRAIFDSCEWIGLSLRHASVPAPRFVGSPPVILSELMADYERRRVEAERHGATAPVATVYALILEEIRAIDGVASPDRMMTTAEAADVRAVAPKTIAKWAAEGRFEGAQKTSEAGEWRLPARSVYQQAGAGKVKDPTSTPRLWDRDT